MHSKQNLAKIIIFAKEDGGGCHFGFCKNGHNFGQD